MKTKNFNIFLLKYILAEDIKSLSNDNIVTHMGTTCQPEDVNSFFSLISASDKESYAKFGEEVCRVEFLKGKGITTLTVFYVIFRNKKNPRTDLGPRKYDFTQPSSVEVGWVDANGAYNSIYKLHYHDAYKNYDLEAVDDAEGLVTLKTIEYAVINSMIDKFNSLTGSQMPFKPISNGRAVLPKKTK